MPAANLTTDRLNQYVTDRLGAGAKPATINRKLALLKRAFSLGMAHTPPKVRFVPKFPHLKEDNVRSGFPTDTEVERVSANCALVGPWMLSLFICLAEYGCRISELLELKVDQIELGARVIRLNPGETKNGRGRIAPMTTRVYALLEHCVKGKTRGWHPRARHPQRLGQAAIVPGPCLIDMISSSRLICTPRLPSWNQRVQIQLKYNRKRYSPRSELSD
jgi:integrase